MFKANQIVDWRTNMENGNNIVNKCSICGLTPPGREPQRPADAIEVEKNSTYEEWVTYWKTREKEWTDISSEEWLRRKELGDKWRKAWLEWRKVDDIHAVCRNRREQLEHSTIPFRYRRAEPLSSTQGNQQALAVVEERKKAKHTNGLFLYGDVGTGKTHLMALYAQHLILYQGENLVWWDTTGLFTSLKNNFNKKYQEDGNDSNEEIMKRAIRASWLFLDDLGREKSSDWTHEVLFHIVNSRYANNRNTIVVTSNYSPPQLAERIGDQIISRLIEMCGEPIKITGADWRLRKA